MNPVRVLHGCGPWFAPEFVDEPKMSNIGLFLFSNKTGVNSVKVIKIMTPNYPCARVTLNFFLENRF